ncbi:stealth family protein [Streptomyces albidoflavus]|uniref:stealth family protein n=1 Tax=Streptomyces albidoflavus TaxID=1886 RepID=UPI000FED5E5F|nr:stealth family protein [Streptomyces albidoflavus]RWZ77603.1 sugar phosphotransferase [Streptomyces albidoflavus]
MSSRIALAAERLLPSQVRAAREEERARAREEARAEAEERGRLEKERRKAEGIAERRRALREKAPDIAEFVVDGGTYYGRKVTSFSAAAAAAHNLELVAAACGKAGVDYFLVPSAAPAAHVVGMLLADRKAFLAAMRELYAVSPVYTWEPGRKAGLSTASLYADGALPAGLKRQSAIAFGEVLLGPSGQVLAGLPYGCEVEFWERGEDLLAAREGDDPAADRAAARIASLRTQLPEALLPGALVAPRPNPVTDTVPAQARVTVERRVAGTDHPTFADLDRPGLEAVDFPVDVVYTWVDGDDPELAARRAAFRGESASAIHSRETGSSRYTSHDELKYSLRSLEAYAPFVRDIYVVTDGQVPSWLDTSVPGIRVVDHREIFADRDALPVFNSHAIGTQLHHIEGLSERYLYLNDDVFFGRPVTAGHFFHGNGVAKLPFSPFQYGLGEPHPDEPAPNSAGKNVRALLWERHARFITNKFMHTPHPQIRSVMRDIEKEFDEAVRSTSRSRFRAVDDIAMGASLHHHHAFFTGRAVPGKYRMRYVDVAREDARERMDDLLTTRRFDFFCLNDVNTPEREKERVARELHTFLETYLPFPSRFEQGDAAAGSA